MFWKKKKEIVVHCYTDRPEVYNYFPVVESKKKIPEWFKKIPVPSFKKIEDDNFKTLNLKQCAGFLGYYGKGFMLPLWSDLALTIGARNSSDYSWQYSDGCSNITPHAPEQSNNHFDPLLYQHLKLVSPWQFHCDEDIPFLAVEPGWQFDVLGTAHILSGVIDFKYQSATHVNVFCTREEKETRLYWKAGMPLYHFIPLTDRKITLKTHLVSHEHYLRVASKNSSVSFVRHYEERKKILEKSGCPFQHELSSESKGAVL
tara:strand:- start:59 stop:835 length:777 start_codon:yes stop_codon:yes gene_type:complete